MRTPPDEHFTHQVPLPHAMMRSSDPAGANVIGSASRTRAHRVGAELWRLFGYQRGACSRDHPTARPANATDPVGRSTLLASQGPGSATNAVAHLT